MLQRNFAFLNSLWSTVGLFPHGYHQYHVEITVELVTKHTAFDQHFQKYCSQVHFLTKRFHQANNITFICNIDSN